MKCRALAEIINTCSSNIMIPLLWGGAQPGSQHFMQDTEDAKDVTHIP